MYGEKPVKKIAFVTPWYGEKIGGGAEAELRGLAHHLWDAGVDLEILTTCVKDFLSDWSVDYHQPGLDMDSGFPVRRFPVRPRDTAAFDAVNAKLIAGETVSDGEEALFMREMINSPELYAYISASCDQYELFVFIPYMFGTTYEGMLGCHGKAILYPCLHDESYAYMRVFRKRYAQSDGMIFLSEPERLLAKRLYGVSGEMFPAIGAGVETEWTGNGERFREKYGIHEPFLLYAGRRDPGKKVDELIRCFREYKRADQSELKLVLLGGVSSYTERDVIDLGFVPTQDKYDAYHASLVFCNPSQFESFSLVIMESWLAGRPVLVNAACEVTASFARQANAGLYYRGGREFIHCLRYLMTHEKIAERMGQNGRQFVMEHFAWDIIVKKYAAYFELAAETAQRKK